MLDAPVRASKDGKRGWASRRCGRQVRKAETVSLDHLSDAHRHRSLEHRSGVAERVEFAVLTAGVHRGGQVGEEAGVELAAAERRVQVAAVNVRRDADDIVRRLSAKGYSAYVEVPRNNASMFRVRVGTFRTRREAQNMAERLQKEEKFKPWVTR